jgi:hypothetical protein
MQVRDAIEADAPALSSLAAAPPDVMRNLVHDRTVRVAATDDAPETGPDEETDPATIRGFVSYDAREDTVHVTQLGGDREACERLLEEPLRFARGEGMTVELLVAVGDDERRAAVEAMGFERNGRGPRFEGEETVRYRWAG